MGKKHHLTPSKWIKWLQEWQSSRQDEAEQVAALDAAIADPDVFKTSMKSHYVAPYLAVRGALKLWQQDPEGWKDIRAYFTMEGSCIATHICHLDKAIASRGGKYVDGRMGVSKLNWLKLNSAVFMMAAAEVFQRPEFAKWLGDRLQTSIVTGDLLNHFPWSKTPFEREMVKMFALRQSCDPKEVDTAFGKGGVYQPLVDAWQSDEEFGKAIQAACDYHLENCRSDDHVFATLPFPFFPVEILAFLGYRRHCGLTTTMPAHPLLETPFAQVPAEFEPYDASHIARRVVERCTRDYPIVATIL